MIISYVIPVKDVNIGYFSDCLMSIIKASRKISYEIIICNDGSKDSYTKEYEKFIIGFPFIKYLKFNTSKGISEARNKCISFASGNWLALVDADDLICSDYVDKFLPFLSMDIKLAYSNHNQYSQNMKKIIQPRNKRYYHELFQEYGNTEFDPMLWATYIFHPQLFDRNAMLDIGMFNTNYTSGDELDAHIRISEKYGVSSIGYVPEFLYKYRKNSNSVVHNIKYYNDLIANMESILSHHFRKRSSIDSYSKRIGRDIHTNAAHYQHYSLNGNPIKVPWYSFNNVVA